MGVQPERERAMLSNLQKKFVFLNVFTEHLPQRNRHCSWYWG